jgi:hypothetical protein
LAIRGLSNPQVLVENTVESVEQPRNTETSLNARLWLLDRTFNAQWLTSVWLSRLSMYLVKDPKEAI